MRFRRRFWFLESIGLLAVAAAICLPYQWVLTTKADVPSALVGMLVLGIPAAVWIVAWLILAAYKRTRSYTISTRGITIQDLFSRRVINWSEVDDFALDSDQVTGIPTTLVLYVQHAPAEIPLNLHPNDQLKKELQNSYGALKAHGLESIREAERPTPTLLNACAPRLGRFISC